jgi:L-threonylcarbamoyladenylate synthase
MEILKLNLSKKESWSKVIEKATTVLEHGGLVIYPTETVYGVGVDAANQEAVKKLLRYKSRREGKPMSIAVTDQKMAENYVEINQQAQKFYQNFLPGPYTIVSKSKGQVAKGVSSEFASLGIRIPDCALTLEIIKKLGRAITSTSANASGKKRPYTIDDILSQLSEKQKSLIDLVIDVGELAKNEPSTVIDTTLSTPITLRGKTDKGKEKFFSESETETKELAARLTLKNWNQLRENGLIFALNGQLGLGKTVFAKGVGQFLKIDEEIKSPSYSYINEYDFEKEKVKGHFYHIDAWKIESKQEFEFLEIKEMIKANNVVLIEWWQQIADFLPEEIRKRAVILNFSEEKIEEKKENNENNKGRLIEIIN